MSILIKGMEMPGNCWLCPLSVLYEKPREMLLCRITKEEVLRNKIDGNCPLVPVPPHGRLIDADVALKSEQPANCSDEMWSKTTLARCIKHAPTIIPAEEE